VIVFGNIFYRIESIFVIRFKICFYRFETDNPLLRFSEAQLAEIRKATLAKILCENMDVPSDLQKAAFDQPNDYL